MFHQYSGRKNIFVTFRERELLQVSFAQLAATCARLLSRRRAPTARRSPPATRRRRATFRRPRTRALWRRQLGRRARTAAFTRQRGACRRRRRHSRRALLRLVRLVRQRRRFAAADGARVALDGGEHFGGVAQLRDVAADAGGAAAVARARATARLAARCGDTTTTTSQTVSVKHGAVNWHMRSLQYYMY